ncbi:MAG: hypothetical protein RBJ76_00900 [Stenomitos frigidus ULC029]
MTEPVMPPEPSDSTTEEEQEPQQTQMSYYQELAALQTRARGLLESGSVPAYVVEDIVNMSLGGRWDLSTFLRQSFHH